MGDGHATVATTTVRAATGAQRRRRSSIATSTSSSSSTPTPTGTTLHAWPVTAVTHVQLHLVVPLGWHVADADAMLRAEMLRDDERRLVLLPVAVAGVSFFFVVFTFWLYFYYSVFVTSYV